MTASGHSRLAYGLRLTSFVEDETRGLEPRRLAYDLRLTSFVDDETRTYHSGNVDENLADAGVGFHVTMGVGDVVDAITTVDHRFQ